MVNIPDGHLRTDEIPRCEACRGFVNPFFDFLDNRRSFRCNLCLKVQPTPKRYQDAYGDYSNTELTLGTYEFVASQDYTARPPKEPTYLFAIDISKSSWAANIPFYALSAAKETIRASRLNGERCATVGFMFFDTRVHLLKLKGTGCSLITLSTQIDANYRPPSVGL